MPPRPNAPKRDNGQCLAQTRSRRFSYYAQFRKPSGRAEPATFLRAVFLARIRRFDRLKPRVQIQIKGIDGQGRTVYGVAAEPAQSDPGIAGDAVLRA